MLEVFVLFPKEMLEFISARLFYFFSGEQKTNDREQKSEWGISAKEIEMIIFCDEQKFLLDLFIIENSV